MLKPEKDGRIYHKKKYKLSKPIRICTACRVIHRSAACPNCFPVNVELERLVL